MEANVDAIHAENSNLTQEKIKEVSVMRDRKSNNRTPSLSVMHVVLLLLCAVIVTSYGINGLYARYRSEVHGTDSARVIRFGDVYLEEAADNNLMLIPGVVCKKEAYISFQGSEASTYVFVVIEASSHWTGNGGMLVMYDRDKSDKLVSIQVEDSWTPVSDENNIFVYAISLDPNQTLLEKQIFGIQNGVQGGIVVSPEMTKADIDYLNSIGKISLQITAIAVQSNGFADYAAAWDSIR